MKQTPSSQGTISGEQVKLDLLAKEFSKKLCTALRKDLNLYGKNLQQEMAGFTTEVEKEAKSTRQGTLKVVAVMSE